MNEVQKLRRDLRVLKWLAGVNIALTVVVFCKVFFGQG